MKRYIEGIMTEARNFSVLRASEFLNFSYQRLQYMVSEARFKDTELETKRLQGAIPPNGHQEREYNFVIDDTQSKKFVQTYFASKCYVGNIGKVDIGQNTVFSSLVSAQEIIPFGFKPYLSAQNFPKKQKDESFCTKLELASYLVENAQIFESILGIKIRYIVAYSVYANTRFMNQLDEGGMKYFFGLRSNRKVKIEVPIEEKFCCVSSHIAVEEGWEIISLSGREFKIKSFICTLREVGHKVKVFIFFDIHKGKIQIYGTNDLSMDEQRAIEYYLQRARMNNKLFRSRSKERKMTFFEAMLLIVFIVIGPILYKAIDLTLFKVESKSMSVDKREKKEIMSEVKGGVGELEPVTGIVEPGRPGMKEILGGEGIKTSQLHEMEAQGELNEFEVKETLKEHLDEGKYVVKKGDTLWGIANRLYTSVKDLKAANKLDREKLDLGKILVIPFRYKEEKSREKDEERIRIKAKGETKNEDMASIPATQPGGKHAVKIGAFQTEEKAEKSVENLPSKEYPGDNLEKREPLVEEATVVSKAEEQKKEQISQKLKNFSQELIKTQEEYLQPKVALLHDSLQPIDFIEFLISGQRSQPVEIITTPPKIAPENIEREKRHTLRLQLFNSHSGILGPEDR